jgi:hypothetical protein
MLVPRAVAVSSIRATGVTPSSLQALRHQSTAPVRAKALDPSRCGPPHRARVQQLEGPAFRAAERPLDPNRPSRSPRSTFITTACGIVASPERRRARDSAKACASDSDSGSSSYGALSRAWRAADRSWRGRVLATPFKPTHRSGRAIARGSSEPGRGFGPSELYDTLTMGLKPKRQTPQKFSALHCA